MKRYPRVSRMLFTKKWQTGIAITVVIPFLGLNVAIANDWPTYRHDSGRTGFTNAALPVDLTLSWSRQLPELDPAFHDSRLQFDAGYEPVSSKGILLLASSWSDSVTAYEAITGRELWSFSTNGPVRLAPVVEGDRVCFGSDDGYFYCLDLATGVLKWKHRAVPNGRMLLGNRRLISVWPVRGGPVVQDGIVYFAAGVWPFEGVFVYAMEIATGRVVWRNEEMGHRYGQQPHNTEAIGGLAPQGYLVIDGDELIVPCSNAYPAKLNRLTGELISFSLPSSGREPGGWFAALDLEDARALRRGKLTFDDLVNRQEHEDGPRKAGGGESGISRTIRVGDAPLDFDAPPIEVEGKVHSIAFASNCLFVTTQEGAIYCFTAKDKTQEAQPKRWKAERKPLVASRSAKEEAANIKTLSSSPYGIAIVVGLVDGSLLEALVVDTEYQIIALDDDPELVAQLRAKFQKAGVGSHRVAVCEVDLDNVELPPYLSTILTTERDGRTLGKFLQTLRPYGGIGFSREPIQKEIIHQQELGTFAPVTTGVPGLHGVRREGALPGAADYKGGFATSEDSLVKFPLGVLWFDDSLAHFKRSPQPIFDQGTMISRPKNWQAERHKGNYKLDYPLLPVVLSDIYTGRVLEETERTMLRDQLHASSPDGLEPSQYRPEGEPFSSKATPRMSGTRISPLTGLQETRVFPKTYGCDGGVDYGAFYTLRSGTAAFYDKTVESGTVFLSGPRSGCTNSIIPSGGLLNVPYFYEGCTCSYPLPTAMSLVSMPEQFEQWSSWGEVEIAPNTLQRLGINFGAPGDRVTRSGTLWLDYPSVGGPSPDVAIEVLGDCSFKYRHSLFMNQEDPYPWVSASVALGIRSVTVKDLKSGNYEVRLFFADLSEQKPGEHRTHRQNITVQGLPVAEAYEVNSEAGGAMRGVQIQVRNVLVTNQLEVSFEAVEGATMISGMELIRRD